MNNCRRKRHHWRERRSLSFVSTFCVSLCVHAILCVFIPFHLCIKLRTTIWSPRRQNRATCRHSLLGFQPLPFIFGGYIISHFSYSRLNMTEKCHQPIMCPNHDRRLSRRLLRLPPPLLLLLHSPYVPSIDHTARNPNAFATFCGRC